MDDRDEEWKKEILEKAEELDRRNRSKYSGVISFMFGASCMAFICFAILFLNIRNGKLAPVDNQSINDNTTKTAAEKIYDKLSLIERNMTDAYFEDTDVDALVDKVCADYLAAYGDKYTVYYDKAAYKKLMTSTGGYFVGIGALASKPEGTEYVEVKHVYDDSPALKAGIQNGDRIIKVDGEIIKDLTLDEAVSKIQGVEGTEVKLTIIRGDDTLEIPVKRGKVDYTYVAGKVIQGDIGYIQMVQFTEVTYKQFKSVYEDLLSQNVKGFIIDVRDNPGGTQNSVCSILDMLLPDGLLMYTVDKNGNKEVVKGVNPAEMTLPCVVIVNGQSASAAELFSGGMQDYGKATIVGTQTFGKGIIQTIKALSDGTAIKYTNAKYFTGKGQDINGKGVTPDVVVELDLESVDWSKSVFTEEDDNQIMKAVEVLRDKMK